MWFLKSTFDFFSTKEALAFFRASINAAKNLVQAFNTIGLDFASVI